MASKRLREFQDASSDELAVKEHDLIESLFRLRLRHRTNQLESSALLRQTRRDVARIKTIQRARTQARNG